MPLPVQKGVERTSIEDVSRDGKAFLMAQDGKYGLQARRGWTTLPANFEPRDLTADGSFVIGNVDNGRSRAAVWSPATGLVRVDVPFDDVPASTYSQFTASCGARVGRHLVVVGSNHEGLVWVLRMPIPKAAQPAGN